MRINPRPDTLRDWQDYAIMVEFQRKEHKLLLDSAKHTLDRSHTKSAKTKPTQSKLTTKAKARATTDSTMKCYECGQPGHFAAACFRRYYCCTLQSSILGFFWRLLESELVVLLFSSIYD